MSGRAIQVAPTRHSLAEAAASYLARYSASERRLRDVLQRRIERWRQAALDAGQESGDAEAIVSQARRDAEDVVAGLVRAGALDDARFAAQRAHSLRQAGRSRRAISAGLMAKGVTASQAHAAAGDDSEAELAACLVLVRRRRLGPFASGDDTGVEDPEQAKERRRRVFGTLARAGFAQDVVRRALAMDREEAEERIADLRRT